MIKQKHIAKMQPAVNKLMAHLKAKGVTFQETDPSGFENIILGYKDKVIKISHHSFYRYSGIACVYKETEALKKANTVETIEVTDEMFMQIFMKPIIETLLHVK